MSSLAVALLVNGVLVAGIPPARLVDGHVMIPLGPPLTQIVERATLTPSDVLLSRGRLACALFLGRTRFVCDGRTYRAASAPFAVAGTAFLPLADLARVFGATVRYDARTRTAMVTRASAAMVASPAPFNPLAPQVAPTQIFTPQPSPPAAATPQSSAASAPPRPRRTAIPATPSRAPL